MEKHLKTQIVQLYKDIVRQKCEIENQVLKNALALIHVAPEDVATAIIHERGHLAIPSGEVVHIIKCIHNNVSSKENYRVLQRTPGHLQERILFLNTAEPHPN